MSFRASSSFVRSFGLPAGASGMVTLVYSSMAERGTAQATNNLVNRSSSSLVLSSSSRLRFRMLSTNSGSSSAAAKETVNLGTEASSASSAANSSKGSKLTLLQWYEGHLESRPVVTKMFTGALLWGLGDGVAQFVPRFTGDSSSNSDDDAEPYDWIRTGRAAFFGFAIHAPTSHVHFNFLEWLTIRTGIKGLGIPIFKAFMEQFVYWSWISNTLYHGAMGAMQGLSPSQIYQRIENVLWETQVAQWKFWIPIQLLNFQFIPVRHQLNVVLLTSIVWTALLSAWYPPEKKEKKKKENVEVVADDPPSSPTTEKEANPPSTST